eukprot:TRINITY_DN16745_c0_g1_i1.p1 TRINITY_DN16745_c0_g1~~TRINITY_DN16745_c0_g1_i1.p1  ORF type:complete len:1062 (+),score=262.22 TRINITY_DN16745_c0_g1_i1:65-3250(+)
MPALREPLGAVEAAEAQLVLPLLAGLYEAGRAEAGLSTAGSARTAVSHAGKDAPAMLWGTLSVDESVAGTPRGRHGSSIGRAAASGGWDVPSPPQGRWGEAFSRLHTATESMGSRCGTVKSKAAVASRHGVSSAVPATNQAFGTEAGKWRFVTDSGLRGGQQAERPLGTLTQSSLEAMVPLQHLASGFTDTFAPRNTDSPEPQRCTQQLVIEAPPPACDPGTALALPRQPPPPPSTAAPPRGRRWAARQEQVEDACAQQDVFFAALEKDFAAYQQGSCFGEDTEVGCRSELERVERIREKAEGLFREFTRMKRERIRPRDLPVIPPQTTASTDLQALISDLGAHCKLHSSDSAAALTATNLAAHNLDHTPPDAPNAPSDGRPESFSTYSGSELPCEEGEGNGFFAHATYPADGWDVTEWVAWFVRRDKASVLAELGRLADGAKALRKQAAMAYDLIYSMCTTGIDGGAPLPAPEKPRQRLVSTCSGRSAAGAGEVREDMAALAFRFLPYTLVAKPKEGERADAGRSSVTSGAGKAAPRRKQPPKAHTSRPAQRGWANRGFLERGRAGVDAARSAPGALPPQPPNAAHRPPFRAGRGARERLPAPLPAIAVADSIAGSHASQESADAPPAKTERRPDASLLARLASNLSSARFTPAGNALAPASPVASLARAASSFRMLSGLSKWVSAASGARQGWKNPMLAANTTKANALLRRADALTAFCKQVVAHAAWVRKEPSPAVLVYPRGAWVYYFYARQECDLLERLLGAVKEAGKFYETIAQTFATVAPKGIVPEEWLMQAVPRVRPPPAELNDFVSAVRGSPTLFGRAEFERWFLEDPVKRGYLLPHLAALKESSALKIRTASKASAGSSEGEESAEADTVDECATDPSPSPLRIITNMPMAEITPPLLPLGKETQRRVSLAGQERARRVSHATLNPHLHRGGAYVRGVLKGAQRPEGDALLALAAAVAVGVVVQRRSVRVRRALVDPDPAFDEASNIVLQELKGADAAMHELLRRDFVNVDPDMACPIPKYGALHKPHVAEIDPRDFPEIVETYFHSLTLGQ